MKDIPYVLIIILNWNKKDDLLTILNQIQFLDYKKFDCLVVDNASTDDSVSEVKSKFPDVLIIENKTNLGGTGGYNTGLDYVLNQNKYKYFWLLDNDTNIEPNTLSELVKPMELDDKVGIAGSRIVDINQRDITIELGAFVDWERIGVTPYSRNKLDYSNSDEVIDVDYVAICSALVRQSALKDVGCMDNKYFIFWDDVDWGLYFKKHGYKVIAVGNSIVYHPSFTERKRGDITDFYYGVRNPLLVYTKHTKPFKRFKLFFHYIRQLLKIILFFYLTNQKHKANLLINAIKDFANNKWGKCNSKIQDKTTYNTQRRLNSNELKADNILIISDNTSENILKLKTEISKYSQNANYTLMISDDRQEVYKKHFKDFLIIETKSNNKLKYNIKLFINIFLKKYDYALITFSNPYAYAVQKCIKFDPENNIFYKCNNDIYHIYIPIISTTLGEILNIFISPYIFFKSIKYKIN